MTSRQRRTKRGPEVYLRMRIKEIDGRKGL
jgi:hypothetical protein